MTRKFGSSPDISRGYTGRMHETDLFGSLKIDPNARKRYEQLYERFKQPDGYVNYNRSMDLVRRSYPEGEEVNPDKEFAKDLRLEVLDIFEIPDDQADSIRFFSAVGTPLDVFHGVDAWIEVSDPDQGRVEVTLDASLKPDKVQEGYKADVIVGDIPDPSDPDYLKKVEEYAQIIADILAQRIYERHIAA